MDCPLGGDAAVHPDAPADVLASAPCVEDAATKVDALEPQSSGVSAEYWRHEVASRLERYRARRKPRAPRYPSLRLPFDSAESWAPVSASALAVSAAAPDLAPLQRTEQDVPHLVEPRPEVAGEAGLFTELFTNVIEFPRYAAVPVHHANELAEPVFERPRIVEAPEVLPPPPALGGMLMEPARNREPERRTSTDLTLNPASLQRRMLAGLFDMGILVAALAGFGGIFVWMNAQRPPLAVVGMAVAIISVILWAAYEFLFTVYTGSTPGLRLAHLKLVKFDGSAPSRRLRRWHVLASYISAFALGLGYLWSVLDEDGLCWHDRITRTHLT